MNAKSLAARVLLAAAVVGSMALSVGSASAVQMRTCPDGTRVPDSQPCLKGKVRAPGGQQQAQNQKPKTDDSAKKWRDYINGNPKPPINPKK